MYGVSQTCIEFPLYTPRNKGEKVEAVGVPNTQPSDFWASTPESKNDEDINRNWGIS